MGQLDRLGHYLTLRGIAIATCLAALSSCTPTPHHDGNTLSLIGLTPDIKKVEISAILNGVRAVQSAEVSGGVDAVLIQVNAMEAGTLTLQAVGLDAQDCAIAEGSTTTSFDPMGPLDLRLQISPIVADTSAWVKQFDSPDTMDLLADLWVVDVNNAWAVGSQHSIQGPFNLKWDGVSWMLQPFFTKYPFLSVWGSDPNNAWAPGVITANINGNVEKISGFYHWDGSTWTSNGDGGFVGWNQVWGVDAKTVWFVGDLGSINMWNGQGYLSQPSSTTNTLRGIWASDANHAWAVGDSGTLLQWDGADWSTLSTSTMANLKHIWGSDVNNLWVTGDNRTSLRWDGRSWFAQSNTCARMQLGAMWGTGPDSIWAVGSDPTAVDQRRVFKWDGIAWSSAGTISDGAFSGPSDISLEAISGVDPNHIWVIGPYGIYQRQP